MHVLIILSNLQPLYIINAVLYTVHACTNYADCMSCMAIKEPCQVFIAIPAYCKTFALSNSADWQLHCSSVGTFWTAVVLHRIL